MQRMVMSVSIQEMLWFFYSTIIFISPEDRLTAKVLLLFIFIYFASVISYVIGKSKRFVFVSLFLSSFVFSMFALFCYRFIF